VAHAEGRFVIPPALLEEITMQGLNVFQYCDAKGEINEHFPVNPNGSVNNIAAVSNKQGNVLAMMPHPERTIACDALFASMRDAILEETIEHVMPLHYAPRYAKPSPYQQPVDAQICLAELVITDLQAWTVQNTLHQLGFPVTVRRKVHWEIKTQDCTVLDHIKRTGMLYHERKEKLCQGATTSPQVLSYLVRPKEDIVGQNKLQLLRDHFNIQAVETIKYGVLWELHGEAHLIQELDEYLQYIHLLGNPYANDHYRYVSP
jgi:phosphoribosylformylglycinamidine synthase